MNKISTFTWNLAVTFWLVLIQISLTPSMSIIKECSHEVCMIQISTFSAPWPCSTYFFIADQPWTLYIIEKWRPFWREGVIQLICRETRKERQTSADWVDVTEWNRETAGFTRSPCVYWRRKSLWARCRGITVFWVTTTNAGFVD